MMQSSYWPNPVRRPRRLRRTEALRRMVCETRLTPDRLVLPQFIMEGRDRSEVISAMPGRFRLSIDRTIAECREAMNLGVHAFALFPLIDPAKKTNDAREALNPENLLCRAVRAIKEGCPDACVITDVALVPYSSVGHDGLVSDDGVVLNDETVEVLAKMAVVHAKAGADIVAPSDMMDGRVAAMRQALDQARFTDTAILSYTAKYASSFYGPFREALDSAPVEAPNVPRDKKTYQLNPANAREADVEAMLDEAEGADILMVKPALPYLDVIARLRAHTSLPIAAYHVSGEYAMIKAAAKNGWLDERRAMTETLTAIARAGADIILTYAALDYARWQRDSL
ncbi:MAG: porphobilinogen synthase [Planctomycetota bacterium]